MLLKTETFENSIGFKNKNQKLSASVGTLQSFGHILDRSSVIDQQMDVYSTEAEQIDAYSQQLDLHIEIS